MKKWRFNRRQSIWLAIIVVVNLLLWLIPSDVVENIARDRHTLLGRYSREHIYANLGFLVFSLVSFYVDWSTGERYKRRLFQVLATLLFLTPALIVVDYLIRTPESSHYVRDRAAYHRPPGFTIEVTYEDRPEALRSYPDAPPGYPPTRCRMTIDSRGYRNAEALEQAEVVVLGDSFAEGSKVSDEHAWPRRLAEERGLAVYNLGMSGYSTPTYLASLVEYGLPLRPRYIICLLYEGNDFRSAKADSKEERPSISELLKRYVKQSPILTALDALMIRTFAPIGRSRHVPGVEILDWLPLAVPTGPQAKPYAFAPKQLRDLVPGGEDFGIDRHWLNPRGNLEEMHELCEQAGAELIVAFAPTKAHVVLPVAAADLPSDDVRAFLALRYEKQLPPPKELMELLVGQADVRETTVGQWCAREGIGFVGLTEPLRRAVTAGKQVYYTYDQHWTPEGHAVVAEAVGAFLAERR